MYSKRRAETAISIKRGRGRVLQLLNHVRKKTAEGLRRVGGGSEYAHK